MIKKCLIFIYALISFNAFSIGLTSPVAIVKDIDTGDIIYQKNIESVRSIASMTKLMTAIVLLESKTDLNNFVEITKDDIDVYKNSTSRVAIGSVLSKKDLLKLALMSSDNRAAHALARTSEYGTNDFIVKMNDKARFLNLDSMMFTDPSGLNEDNKASAKDMLNLLEYANKFSLIHQFSTLKQEYFNILGKKVLFKNTNSIIRDNKWNQASISKTGYTNEAGRCVSMLGMLGKKHIALVLMSNKSSAKRTKDVEILIDSIKKGKL